jgi:hypothetical protein
MIDYKDFFSKNVLTELCDNTDIHKLYRNFKRVHSMELMKIREASIDRLGYFHCLPDLPFINSYLDNWDGNTKLFKIIDRSDVLLEVYTIKPSFCTVFTYSFYNKEIVIERGNTDIDNPLKIFKEGLPMLQFGKNIYVKSDEVPIAKFALLDFESRIIISDYRINKYHGCKLQHKSGHDAQIFHVDEYGFSTNEIRFIT